MNDMLFLSKDQELMFLRKLVKLIDHCERYSDIPVEDRPPVRMVYDGDREYIRTISPERVFRGSTPWHMGTYWYLKGYDQKKGKKRYYVVQRLNYLWEEEMLGNEDKPNVYEEAELNRKLKHCEKVLWWIKQCPGLPYPDTTDIPIIEAWYTNHRGKYKLRRIRPFRVYWGSTEWHPEKQFLLETWDEDQMAMRDFAIKDFDDVDPVQS